MMDREQLLARHGDMVAQRQPFEAEWREIARILRPEQKHIGTPGSHARIASEIYDSTPLYELDGFAGGVFGQLTNPANPWFKSGVPDHDLNMWKPARDWFEHVSTVMGQSLTPNYSSFYAEKPAQFADLGAFGLGTMYQEEDVGRGRFIDRTIPLNETYVEFDAFGEVIGFNRQFMLTGRQFTLRFNAPADWKIDEKKQYTVIHSVWLNPARRERALDHERFAFLGCYLSPDVKELYRAGGYHEMPYSVAQWARRSGFAYPVGIGHLARPDINTLQESARSTLVAEQFAAEPPILVDKESDLTAADMRPNNFLYGAINDAGKPVVQTLNRSQNLSLTFEGQKTRRDQIRAAFKFGLLNFVMNRPQMTATEFLGINEEHLRLMAPNLARIQSTDLSPFLARRFKLLERAGAFRPAPEELEGLPLQFEYVSPLAKLMKAGEARAVMQWLSGVTQLAQFDPTVLDNIDGDAIVRITHDGFAAPARAIRDPRKVDEMRQARATQVAQDRTLDIAGKGVTIAAEAAHASQAASLSQQRGRP